MAINPNISNKISLFLSESAKLIIVAEFTEFLYENLSFIQIQIQLNAFLPPALFLTDSPGPINILYAASSNFSLGWLLSKIFSIQIGNLFTMKNGKHEDERLD